MAPLKPYYYMVYAIRRMLGSGQDSRDIGEWRAVAFFLMIQVQFLLASIAIFVPDFFSRESAPLWALAVGIPALVSIYWLLGGRKRYSQYAVGFDSWPSAKRRLADFCALLFGASALLAPIVAKSIVA